ncbi:unnamed protein product [Heligmosomoides polygyrus]|uniref:Endo/exonuclease/phosphatase domain-containing protein n=1 Tax=Heligmosomoides polygyrus TaxID=6339 RepID=A0A183FDV2_HELPZ|nr:unnamed protein product [Heligmosomoides polygyrus]
MRSKRELSMNDLQKGPCDLFWISLIALTVFVAYAPTSDYDDEEVEAFYVELEKFYKEDHTFYKVIVGDFNAKIGPRRSPEELHIGTHGLEWNEQGERLSEFILSIKAIHGNSQFQKPPSLRWTWKSLGGESHNEIDHIIFNWKYCLTDVSVVPKFYTGSDHRLLSARFRFSRQGEKAAKFKKRNPRTTINWDLYTYLANLWEDTVMDNIDEEYDRFVHHLHDSTKGAESLKTTKRRSTIPKDVLEAEKLNKGFRKTIAAIKNQKIAPLTRQFFMKQPALCGQ